MERKFSIAAACLAPAALALALAACGGVEPADPDADFAAGESAGSEAAAGTATPHGGERNVASSPLPDDGLVWRFSRSAVGPKLAYGEPQTDNVRLTLRCGERGRIRLSFMRPAGTVPIDLVTVGAGGAAEGASAETSPTKLGGVSVEAAVSANSAPLIEFRSGHSLRVTWPGSRITVPAAGAEADRLFEACSD